MQTKSLKLVLQTLEAARAEVEALDLTPAVPCDCEGIAQRAAAAGDCGRSAGETWMAGDKVPDLSSDKLADPGECAECGGKGVPYPVNDSVSVVARYYDRFQWLYNFGWSAGGSRSLHYGLWWDDTRSLAEAIVNGDRFVAEKLAVHASDHVLDMGCGVGGTSVFLAKTFGCRVTGITVSRIQLEQAAEHAAASGVRHLVQFELMNYTAMTFRDATFTKAFTQETSNYAVDKRALLRETHRVLAPGGCYVSLDVFQSRDARPGEEESRLRRALRGWACAGLEHYDRYLALAREVGLDVVESGDVSARTGRSSRAIWRRHVFLYPLAYLAWRVGSVPAELLWHFQASIEQKDLYCATDNLLMMGYLVAKKPQYTNTASEGNDALKANSVQQGKQ